MFAALRKYFPTSVHWMTPQVGLFLCVTLPESLETPVSLQAAIAENVVFVLGSAFFADGSGHIPSA